MKGDSGKFKLSVEVEPAPGWPIFNGEAMGFPAYFSENVYVFVDSGHVMGIISRSDSRVIQGSY
jgi:hypothetical protein